MLLTSCLESRLDMLPFIIFRTNITIIGVVRINLVMILLRIVGKESHIDYFRSYHGFISKE